MGLDMYLKADRHVSGWDHNKDPKEKELYKKILKIVGAEDLVTPDSPSLNVSATVAYWRKANAIHSWFVQNLADGVDECQEVYVSSDDLQKLIDECQGALDLYEAGKLGEAEKAMQPVGGFFFGSTEIDDYWAEDLKRTIHMLTPLLEVGDKFDFHYQASW